MVLSDSNIPKLPKSQQLMGINFYHTNAIFIDPALIQVPGAYSGKYGIINRTNERFGYTALADPEMFKRGVPLTKESDL